jgi:hypothetical protein
MNLRDPAPKSKTECDREGAAIAKEDAKGSPDL